MERLSHRSSYQSVSIIATQMPFPLSEATTILLISHTVLCKEQGLSEFIVVFKDINL